MTSISITTVGVRDRAAIQARPAPPLRDVVSIAGRALRAVPREPESVIPPVFIALFLFMTSSYVPRSQLSGWLSVIATWNPVTYVLEGLRSLVTIGWEWASLGKAVLAIAAVGVLSMSLCLAALRGRTRRG